MNRDDIIRMAREAGMSIQNELQTVATCKSELERFADAIIESVAQHLETSSDRHRRDYFAAKVMELKTQEPAQPAGQGK